VVHGNRDYAIGVDKPEVSLRPTSLLGSGTALFSDDFESPSLKWEAGTYDDSAVGLTTTQPFNGDACMYLLTKSVNPLYVSSYRQIGAVITGKVGLQLSWMTYEDTLSYLNFYINVNTGARLKSFGVQYDTANEKWQYFNDSFVATDLIDFTQKPWDSYGNWHTAKIVYDLTNDAYAYLTSDGETCDMQGLSGRNIANTTKEHYYIVIWAKAPTATQRNLYIDDVIVTQEQ